MELDTSSDGRALASSTAATSSSSATAVNGSTSRRVAGTGMQQQQRQQLGSMRSGGGSGLNSGVGLDSLTPLSCRLFDVDMLGVTKEGVLQVARLAKSEGFTTLSNLNALVTLYCSVFRQQVSQQCRLHVGPCFQRKNHMWPNGRACMCHHTFY
jgi:hypothetical protein